MDWLTLLVGLIETVALYALAVLLVGAIYRRIDDTRAPLLALATGAILGATAWCSMLLPVQVEPGVLFDGRVVPVALAGLLAGPIGAAVAVLPPALYRLWLGGVGMPVGVVSLLAVALVGATIHWWLQRRGRPCGWQHLALTGTLLPVATMLALLLLPSLDLARQVANRIFVPIVIFYPLATLLFGQLLLQQRERTDLRRTAQRQRATLTSILAQAPAVVARYRIGPDGQPVYEYVSERSGELLGIEADDLLRDSVRGFKALHPDDRERLLAHIRNPDPSVAGAPIDYRIVHPDQSVRWVRRTATQTHDRQGSIWHSVTTDITAERDAAQREYVLAQIVREIGTPVFQLDTEFNITFLNAAAERIYGYRAEEVVGRPGVIFRPPDRTENMAEFLGHVASTRQPDSIETEALHKDGRRIPIQLHIAPLLTPDGELAGWSSVIYDLSAHKAHAAELERLATTDELTGVANRRAFLDAAGREIKRARRFGHALALVMGDIDHFKTVNDTYGHAAGDAGLRGFVAALKLCLRERIDVIGRLGGEEFAILLPETDTAGATVVAERIRQSVADARIRHDGVEFGQTASFGISELGGEESDPVALLARADDALYEAKRGGRNRVASVAAPAVSAA